jgi:superfamily II DNA or RNA helicase
MSPPMGTQNLPVGPQAPVVSARGWSWTPTGIADHGEVAVIRVARLARDAPDLDALLFPFDRISTACAPGWRKVSHAWLRAWVARWPNAWPAVPVSAPLDVDVWLLPHQLVPLLALARGEGLRAVIADGVGLGKTIEAGLVIRELAARGAAERALVVAPIAVRAQWRSQLRLRCGLDAAIIDRGSLRASDRGLPPGVGPFEAPGFHVISADLAKQADVLARLADVCWDVVIVDEAHGVAGDSARAAALGAIAARARVVVLLTATPHAGDAAAFRRLCRVGWLHGESEPLWFCRRARPTGAEPTIQRDVRARPSADERRSAAALRRYLRLLERDGSSAARLVALVLRKRALSSPEALARSLRHRLSWLEGQPAIPGQPALPFDDGEATEEDAEQPSVLHQPGLTNPNVDAASLRPAIEAAELAARSWRKAHVLRRLLARTRERVLIFTEYRDTLAAVAGALEGHTSIGVLHGGLGAAARELVLSQFASGVVRTLVATDVAAEGLNLQHSCRLVVHMELPWSPARLEQRNGRVDRLGQTRRVHVWRLLGQAGHEARIVKALNARVERMRADGIEVPQQCAPHAPTRDVDTPPVVRQWDDPPAVANLLRDLVALRRLTLSASRPGSGEAPSRVRRRLPWLRARPIGGGLPPGVTFVFMQPAGAPGSRAMLAAVHVALSAWPAGSPSSWLMSLVPPAASMAHTKRCPLTEALRQREHALLVRARGEARKAGGRWQSSLFDRRAARIVTSARERASARVDAHLRRLEDLQTRSPAPVPVLALLVR